MFYFRDHCAIQKPASTHLTLHEVRLGFEARFFVRRKSNQLAVSKHTSQDVKRFNKISKLSALLEYNLPKLVILGFPKVLQWFILRYQHA